ncbi:unnamed protein product [Pleuronectes platessa]|uniref:Uncharacterized protein n=1 Tax=Pleuronectes platessa TaxID=8262 RepID=A0A9N7TIQ7_PLEPL|nr:unnamed protein product [Pleuronectes platessa]
MKLNGAGVTRPGAGVPPVSPISSTRLVASVAPSPSRHPQRLHNSAGTGSVSPASIRIEKEMRRLETCHSVPPLLSDWPVSSSVGGADGATWRLLGVALFSLVLHPPPVETLWISLVHLPLLSSSSSDLSSDYF